MNSEEFPAEAQRAIGKTIAHVLRGSVTDTVLVFTDGTRLMVYADYDGHVLAAWEPSWSDDDHKYATEMQEVG